MSRSRSASRTRASSASVSARLTDLIEAKNSIRGQLLQLGLGGEVVATRATRSVAAAVQRAGRNVHAVGVGRKSVKGSGTGTLCIRIYVVQKLPKSLLSPRDVIPERIDGLPTDVVEATPAIAFARAKTTTRRKPTARRGKPAASAGAAAAEPCTERRRLRQRPIPGGISAGHYEITAGTLGCFCRSTRAGDLSEAVFALSNNHVFADVNQATLGDPLYQPGPLDGGVRTDHFANLERYVPIRIGGSAVNEVDCAIGRLLDGITWLPEVCSIGRISGIGEPEDGLVVRKHGRTTGLTTGTVDDISYDALVDMGEGPGGVALFENQFRIESTGPTPVGLGGDSGSIVFRAADQTVVGLYFAGPRDGSYGIANRISKVVSSLEIELL